MNEGYHHNNKSIAVVDDEEDNVTLFTKVWQENNYHVIGFTNPLFFLDYIRRYPDKFGLIVVDYRMSPMHGSCIDKSLFSKYAEAIMKNDFVYSGPFY